MLRRPLWPCRLCTGCGLFRQVPRVPMRRRVVNNNITLRTLCNECDIHDYEKDNFSDENVHVRGGIKKFVH